MREQDSGMMLVRAELCDRLAELQRYSERRKGGDFARAVDSIRLVAAAHGLTPVARLAEALERAMAESHATRIFPAALYLDRLQDAIGCSRMDDQASEAMIASVSVRFGG